MSTIGIIGKSNGNLLISTAISADTEPEELYNSFTMDLDNDLELFIHPDNNYMFDGFDFTENQDLIQKWENKQFSIDLLTSINLSYKDKEDYQRDYFCSLQLINILNSELFKDIEEVAFIIIYY